MGALVIVIPLAAMALPIALILIAVTIDIGALVWAAYRWWHDDGADRLETAISRSTARLLRASHLPG